MKSFRQFYNQKIQENIEDESRYDAEERFDKDCDRFIDNYLKAEESNNKAEMAKAKSKIDLLGSVCSERLLFARYRKKTNK